MKLNVRPECQIQAYDWLVVCFVAKIQVLIDILSMIVVLISCTKISKTALHLKDARKNDVAKTTKMLTTAILKASEHKRNYWKSMIATLEETA